MSGRLSVVIDLLDHVTAVDDEAQRLDRELVRLVRQVLSEDAK